MKIMLTLKDGVDIDQCSQKLTEIGMKVDEKLDFIMTITGEIQDKDLKKIATLGFILTVEAQGEMEALS